MQTKANDPACPLCQSSHPLQEQPGCRRGPCSLPRSVREGSAVAECPRGWVPRGPRARCRLRRIFPFIGGAAAAAHAAPLPPAPPPRCRSCLCSCAPGQMGEVILAGKKNTLLFGGCFNLLFPARSIPCSGSPCRRRAVPGQLQYRRMGESRASALSALNHWGHTQGTGPAI